MKKVYVLSTVAILFGSLASSADGTLGTESDDSFQVSVDLSAPEEAKIQIKDLRDVSFSKTAGDDALPEEIINACVYMDKSGSYGIDIEANPLVDDVNHYPYNIEVYQEIDSPNRIVLNVEDSMDEASGTGFSPSANESCFGQPKLYVKVEDAATDGITSAFSATAEVRITVKPE